MTRRKLVALVGVFVLLALGLVVFAAGLFVTHTTAGRERLRAFVVPLVKNAIKGGDIYIGHLGGNFLGSLTIDSVAIRDKRGDLFLSTGPITVSYNWRDIADQRIYIRRATIEHPFVHIVQHETGVWNFKEIFASSGKKPTPQLETQTRSFGDYIVIDSATTHNGTFLLSMPWHPDDSLHGARLDSVIRAHLDNPEKAVQKTFDGYARLYAWRNGNGLISHIRLADPDSDRKFGQEFKIGSLSVDEYVPTFKFSNVRGEARHLGDSVWFDIPHFDMPASTGHGQGKVWWGSDLPVRYDIAIRGDSVSLNDVNWVYPTLPRTGGGTLDLAIKNDPRNLQVVDFQLRDMDVRSTKSHLTGDMWFGIGAPILLVRNVDLKADPVDFDLIRTLNGKPFPIDWQGQLFGTVKGRGGPLTHFVVDDARGTFADAHVRGAESRFSAKGELDILYPAFTTFHAFDVNVAPLDLRTVEYVLPSFPRLGGFISGSATLDSSWLDVRFSNAQITHQDGPGDPSHITGSGRVTYGEKFMTYDVNLNAEPLSLTMLARSYPALPPHLGLWSGPIAASGSSPDLALKLALQGAHGALSYDGRVDIDSIGGMGANGHGQFSALNVASLLELPRPAGTISGHYDVDVTGENAATLTGSAGVDLERTVLDSVRVYPSVARVRFAGGQMKLDTLRVHTDAATVLASGGIGLPNGRPDSARFSIIVDSLGGLRPFISHPDTSLLGAARTLPDSLSGAITVNGDAVGTLDAMRVEGRLGSGGEIDYKGARAAVVSADFSLDGVPSAPRGTVRARLDSVVVGGVALNTVNGTLVVNDLSHAGFIANAISRNGPTATVAGAWGEDHGAQTLTLDSLGVSIADDRWTLANHPHFVFDSAGTRLDSLVLHNRDSAVVAMSGRIPSAGAGFAQLTASGLPVRDFGMLAQLPDTITGIARLNITANGPRDNPIVDANAVLTSVNYHNIGFDRIAATATHRDARVHATLQAVREGRPVIAGDATLPIAVSLFGTQFVQAPIDVSLRADTTDLSLLKLFVPTNTLPVVSGRLAADVHVGGTWARPVLNGTVDMIGGAATVPALGVSFDNINGHLFGAVDQAGQDSINVAITAHSSPRGTASLSGFVRNLAQPHATAFSLSLTADSLHAFRKSTVADLTVSTVSPNNPAAPAPLTLSGTLAAPVLTGTVNIDRGSIYIADRDLARKLPVDVFSDSAAAAQRSSLFTTLNNNLQVQNAFVTLGQDVRLRSTEADVRLSGRLEMVNSPTGRSVSSSALPLPGVTVVGQLTTTGGTYNLNLGLVQREFSVLPDGTVTFDGGPALTPLVDIRAQYNVKQPHQSDLGVIVTLRGRMPTPSITLSSNADYEISSSDLVSYLVVGSPGFDFTGQQNQLLASVLSPTVSAFAADRLRQSLGGIFDAFEFQLGTSNGADQQAGFFSRNNLSQYLLTSTVTAEKQLTNNLYLGVNTSFCQIQNNRLGVGAKVEYRFRPALSLQAGYEPPTGGTCAENQTIVGFVPTPSQWSLSLLHSWRF